MSKLPTPYQQFIHLSRYARWIPEEKRRETWEETVDRYMDYMCDVQCKGKIPAKDKKEIREAILNLEVMPSMRCMMTAGPALARDNVAGFNCSYLAIDDPMAFDEMLYILMCGTGVGFSVERQFIAKMPEVAEQLRPSKTIIVVEDSKGGWADAYRELISMLYRGRVPQWDTSKVRKAGERLKTFGGRASGPQPLVDLFKFTINIFQGAVGRKLTSIECHDICCKIGDIVVVGGVRRSAEISLSNPSDDRMRHAKSGNWHEATPWRALANNSACYTEKPDMGVFMREWIALYDSKSGERGIFNRQASKKQIEMLGRRDSNYEFGTNPCISENSWVMTGSGPRQVRELIGTPFTAIVDGKNFRCETGFFKTGNKILYRVTLENGMEMEMTDNHPLLKAIVTRKTEYVDWTELKDLEKGDLVKISDHGDGLGWNGKGNSSLGYLLGQLVGDGGFIYPSGDKKSPLGYVRFWEGSKEYMSDLAMKCVESSELKHRSDLSITGSGVYKQIGFVSLYKAAKEFGISDCKTLTEKLEKTSSQFYRGFLKGFFDADGCIQGNHQKGISVRLGQANLGRLQVVQRMLSRLGINSTLYKNREDAGYRMLPDGNGGLREYYCEAMHELSIANDNILRFEEKIGFGEPAKKERLSESIKSYKRVPNRERFAERILSIEKLDREDVYDCTVEGAHEFDCNGLRVHNCSEIILRSCQFCNLSEVVIRPEDTLESLKRKVRLATIIGTMQSSLTNFRYLRDAWRHNTEEEALLGVSMTGILDNSLTSGQDGEEKLTEALRELRTYSVHVNEEWAEKIGVNHSAATTCIKPSGCATLDTRIKTDKGILSFAEIFKMNDVSPQELIDDKWITPKVSLFVFDKNNERQLVTKLYVNGVSDVYEIEDEEGRVAKFTGNHKLLTKDGWKRVDLLTVDDEITSF